MNIEEKKHYYFYCCIENDLLINAGISQIIKLTNPKSFNTLLVTSHPRIINKFSKYSQYFDDVIQLPFCSFSKNIFYELRKANKLIKSLKNIEFNNNSILFMFDIYDFADLIVYKKIKENRNTKTAIVTAFERDELNPKSRTIVLKGTILKSFYSLLFTRKLFYEYKTKDSQYDGINYFLAKPDIQICINNSNYRTKAKAIYKEIPSPSVLLNSNNFNNIIEGNDAIIIFIESSVVSRLRDYWNILNKIINKLKINNNNIYIKDHPNSKITNYTELIGNDIKIIDSKVPAEELFIKHSENISSVFAHGSTALITASWFGIKGYDLTSLFSFSKSMINRFNKFLELGDNISLIDNINKLDNIKKGKTNPKIDKNHIISKWAEVVKSIDKIKQ
ncbi:MAG: hypothetical protein WC223_10000 [Bacteroidales bacterium]|jgi:hypothetical protein